MKCNQSRPGFELVLPCPFPTTITITPQTPPKITSYIAVGIQAFKSNSPGVLTKTYGWYVMNGCNNFHFQNTYLQMYPIFSYFFQFFRWCGVIWCSTVAWRACSGRTSLCSAATRKWWPSTTVSLPTPRLLLIWRAAAIPPGKFDWTDTRFIYVNKHNLWGLWKEDVFSITCFLKKYSIECFLFIRCNEFKILI